MHTPPLTLPNQKFVNVPKAWLNIAILSLAIAGLFSLPPVILRGSFFESFFDIQHVFDVALMIHVNLSVLVWMFAINGLALSYLAKDHLFFYRITHRIALVACLCMAFAPFAGESIAYKNNYVPILHNPLFLLGLGLFTCSVIFQATLAVLAFNKNLSPLLYGFYNSAWITLSGLLCFVIAYQLITPEIRQEPLIFYEMLFWGGGHIIQLTYTLTMTMVWLWFAKLCGIALPFTDTTWKRLLTCNTLIIIIAPLFYLNGLEESALYFTEHMRFVGGILPTLLGLLIIRKIFTANIIKEHRPIFIALCFSMLLFFFGGILGFLISGANAVIPAHYHGSIVGITVAFMGLVYHLLPTFNYLTPRIRWSQVQLWTYGVGQLCHISGLALMGGYGALRKTAGSAASIETTIGKIFFFSGGSFAIIGGLLFVVIAGKCVLTTGRDNQPA